MDAYPSDYVDHNLPLIVISGLGSPLKLENEDNNSSYRHGAGSAVTSDFPAVEGDRAAHLLQEFLSADANPAPWNGRAIKGKDGLLGFRIRATGRVGLTPIAYELRIQITSDSVKSTSHYRPRRHRHQSRYLARRL